MREIKFDDKEMCEVINRFVKETEELDTETVFVQHGLCVDHKNITFFVPMYINEGELFIGSDDTRGIFMYDRETYNEMGFYAEEIGGLNDKQAIILVDLVENILEDRVMSEDIHNAESDDEEELTEYDEFLMTLNDLSDYVEAMRTLYKDGIKGLPIASLVDECMIICQDLEAIAMDEE